MLSRLKVADASSEREDGGWGNILNGAFELQEAALLALVWSGPAVGVLHRRYHDEKSSGCAMS